MAGAKPSDGAVVLWFILVAIFTLLVAADIRTTPEALVMKVGFVVITLYSGPFGALLYALRCREPMPGTHEQFVAAS
jgi:CHASE2 domain-containing sensor protein